MAQELTIEGKTFISSKRAAQMSGYAQDYIGQLARKGLIEARRIGGLWYVLLDSLNEYQKEAEAYKPQPPTYQASDVGTATDTVISMDGTDYVSAARAAALTGYTPDYVGQLARAGTVLSRQVGNRWYVSRQGVLEHKKEKDALLAAVQANAVGIARSHTDSARLSSIAQPAQEESMRYFSEENDDLMPNIAEMAPELKEEEQSDTVDDVVEVSESPAPTPVAEGVLTQGYTPVPIRKIPEGRAQVRKSMTRGPKRNLSPFYMASGAFATIIIVLSVGVTTMKSGATYTLRDKLRNAAASIEGARSLEAVATFIESHFIPPLTYHR